MPNFKPYGRHWRPCGRIFKFCKFWRKKKEIETFEVISENSSPKGFFWPNKKFKKSLISLLSADSRYFRTYALKIWILSSAGWHYPDFHNRNGFSQPLFGLKVYSPWHSTSFLKRLPFRGKICWNEVACPKQNACLTRLCHFGRELNKKICVFHRWISIIFVSHSLVSDIDECTPGVANPCVAKFSSHITLCWFKN